MQTEATELARSLSLRERRARALAQAEADAAEREAAEAEAELGAVAAEVARLATEPEPEPAASGAWTRQLEGTIAHAIREPSSWLAVWPSAMRCRTALQAARLRLVLAFLHSERLTGRCPLVLEAGRVTDTIVSCWKVRPDYPTPPRLPGLSPRARIRTAAEPGGAGGPGRAARRGGGCGRRGGDRAAGRGGREPAREE